jgi:hypothetical protein
MLRRLKREVLGQLPAKRRQVVRLPAPDKAHWPEHRPHRRSGEGLPLETAGKIRGTLLATDAGS